ncbi:MULTISPECIES: hypothetical protein [unclassified Streptomyces]|uniref:hypothetical protein n=1 Tax=unclassified Streptomyces TaxID=2593676 RepID=UPI0006ADA4DF|nr:MULTISPECIES: hypothetical protein [unclassified Streptomyces]KOX19772.1 hypothetical protein ADL06_28665 [Streptomyces sp. NRRL F-6491]KOX37895.1 hypothetical protein ADL08_28380 [Streptomyces sp. NRRL F-6492]
MSTAPTPPSSHPQPGPGSPTGPFPPPPPRPPRRRGWFARQSEGVRITIIGAVIAGVFSLGGAVLTAALTDRGDGPPDAKPSARQTPAATTGTPAPATASKPPSQVSSDGPSSTPRESGDPSADEGSAPPASESYEESYAEQTMSLGLPPGSDLGSIDFDAPGTHRYTDDEWAALEEKAGETGVPVEADLTYRQSVYGILALKNGRNAAQLQSTEPSEKAADCARAARVGGFTEARMHEWDLPAKTVLCVVTDKGNIARVVITGFIGGDSSTIGEPPTQIGLRVTLWKPRA